jgi:hypothetical protein
VSKLPAANIFWDNGPAWATSDRRSGDWRKKPAACSGRTGTAWSVLLLEPPNQHSPLNCEQGSLGNKKRATQRMGAALWCTLGESRVRTERRGPVTSQAKTLVIQINQTSQLVNARDMPNGKMEQLIVSTYCADDACVARFTKPEAPSCKGKLPDNPACAGLSGSFRIGTYHLLARPKSPLSVRQALWM